MKNYWHTVVIEIDWLLLRCVIKFSDSPTHYGCICSTVPAKTVNAVVNMAVFMLSTLYLVSCRWSIGIGRLTRDSNRWNFEPVSIRSLNYSRRLNSSKMHRFQSWRLTYRKVRYCKNFFIRRFFFRTDALSFILFTRFYNGRSCANVACNLCWRLSYACLFPLLFFFFFF